MSMKQFYSKTNFFYKSFLFLFFITFQGYGQIFSDPITGNNITSGSTYFKSATGTTINPNVTVDGIRHISTTGGNMNANNAYYAYNWTSNSIDLNKYFEISLTPNSCRQINFNTLSITFKINDQNWTNYGPTNVAIRSSLDNYTSNLYTYNIVAFDYGWTANVNIASLLSINSNVKFRIYAWGGTSSNFNSNFGVLDYNFTNGSVNSFTVPTPTVNLTAANCSSNGKATITNYNSGYTYTFNPATAGISINTSTGLISGLTYGTSYIVTASSGICSTTSTNFTVNQQYATPTPPTIGTITQPTCVTATGSVVLTGLPATGIWTINPGGITGSGTNTTINGLTNGTYNFTVTNSSNCTSTQSGNIVINTQPSIPTIPTINTTPTTCASPGTATITNYSASNAYTFTPSGPTVSSGGIINNIATGTAYTVQSNNGTCNSGSSTSFVIADNSSTTWNGSSWSNGIPDLTKNAIILGDYDMEANTSLPNIIACSMTLNSPAKVIIKSNGTLTLQNALIVSPSSSFIIKNSASLVQINNNPSPANSGSISMERIAFVDFRDYVYWSTPVANFNSANISTYSNNTNLYKWIPTTGGVNGFGNWTSGVETMVLGKGYIERGLNNAALNSPVNFTSTFIGTPNNGNITTPISRGIYSGVNYATGVSTTPATDDDDNWNLLGNPYPSAISAADFLNANSTNLDGFVKIWTHGIAPSTSTPDPFYNNYGYNYDPNDYITWNLSGPSTPGFSGYIGAGQGFITKMKHTSPTTSSTAVFNNTMRNATHKNNEFFKSAKQQKSLTSNEGRIWIDLVSSTASTRSLIAYVNGATNERDQMYDAQADLKSNFRINSLLGPEKLTIQGRLAPFNTNDKVYLAFSTPTNGTYNIAIGAVDGLFEDQNQGIYLEDKQLNIIHDLRLAPYQFTTTQGENIDRFVLRYTNQTLSNNVFDYNNSVSIYANENINIKSSSENIRDIRVYDVVGKTLLNKNKINKNEIILSELKPTSGLIIIKVILDNGSEITKKVIF